MTASSQIYNILVSKLEGFLHAIFPSLMNSFGLWIPSLFTLSLILTAIAWLFGKFGESSKEVGISMVMAVILYFLILDTTSYFYWIVDPFFSSFKNISNFFVQKICENNAIGTNDVNGLFLRLDAMFGKIIESIQLMQPQGNIVTKLWSYIISAIGLIILLFAYSLVYLAFFTIMALALFALHIYFLVGGIFIFFAAWKTTRHISWSWFRSVLNQGFVMILASMVMAMCLFGINGALDNFIKSADITRGFFTFEYAAIIVWCFVCFIMILKVPDIAASLSGGISGSTFEIARTVSLIGGGSMALTKGGIRTGVRGLGGLGGLAGNAYSKIRGL